MGNHTRLRPACGSVIRSISPSSRSRASRRLVCSIRTPGAITQCICSVFAIRYCTNTPSANRSPPPASTSIITTHFPSGTAPACPGAACTGKVNGQP
ncbi:hypothetical protein [Streptomyces pseudovenezuelae]|uniref:hypothetical protein n=1 Tax=Streptomyces pseudovenezuelae TaxID=67350 RepID=UPI0036E5CA8C